MASKSKVIYILAGPNGAGKTTFALSALEKDLEIDEFVNADEIARGLAPLKPESASLQAGKLMLQKIDELLSNNKSFCIETTLAGKNYIKLIRSARKKGYKFLLVFLWLPGAKMAKDRVKNRVKQGGHNIPEDVIERRYKQGQKNLVDIYMKVVDTAYIINNTEPNIPIDLRIIAEKASKNNLKVYNKGIWQLIKSYGNNK